MTLRCPNCEWLGDGVWDHAAVVAYDAKLCAATDDILFILEAAAREAGWSDF